MSRTDNHMPYRVRVRYRPEHHPSCIGGRRPCDFPDHDPRMWRTYRIHTRCYWTEDDDRTSYRRFHSGVPGWYVHHRWWNPQRLTVRDLGRRAVAEYRATGDVTTILPIDQHRHSAAWDWT